MMIRVPSRGKRPLAFGDLGAEDYALEDELDVYDVLLNLAAGRFSTWGELVAESGVSRTTLWRAANALRTGERANAMKLDQVVRLLEAVDARLLIGAGS
jgi:hypothetical protein